MTKPKPAPQDVIDMINRLAGHGWDRYGIAMSKGEHKVIVAFRGSIEVSGPGTPPEELMEIIKGGRKFDA